MRKTTQEEKRFKRKLDKILKESDDYAKSQFRYHSDCNVTEYGKIIKNPIWDLFYHNYNKALRIKLFNEYGRQLIKKITDFYEGPKLKK